MNLSELLRQGESETVEFKTSFNEEVLESIGAFANARGGVVLVGVEDSSSVCGVQVGKKTLEDWAHRIQEATDPRLQPSIHKVEKEGTTVAAITVEPVTGVPVSIRRRCNRQVAEAFFYIELIERWGSGTTRMADLLSEAGLPEPEFDASNPYRFRVIFRQDPFTEERLRTLNLNERQIKDEYRKNIRWFG